MTPYLFVYNPKAGSGQNTRLEEHIARYMGDSPFVFCTIDQMDQELEKGPWKAVVAMGGDGTVNSVGKRCKEKQIPLGIIPRGSGDGLARHIGMPHALDKAIEVILTGRQIGIDTATAGGHFFVNVAGTGFEAQVAHRFANARKRGLISYIQSIRSEYSSFEDQQAQLQQSDQTQNISFFSLSFANGSQWGNNFRIASAADLQDGQLQLVILSRPKWHQITGLLRYLRSNLQEDRVWVKHRDTLSLDVHSSSSKWHLDGEPVHLNNPVEIRIHPNSLQLIIPHG